MATGVDLVKQMVIILPFTDKTPLVVITAKVVGLVR